MSYTGAIAQYENERGVRGAMEHSTGVEPLDALHAERTALADQQAPLWAIYGPNGTYSENRENLFAAIGMKKRLELEGSRQKVTEGMIEEAVRTDKRYKAYIARVEKARADFYVNNIRLENITERIMRDAQLAKWATESMKLGG
jgi:hypothetical protein